MKFLTRDTELSFITNDLIYFYTSEKAFPLGEMMFQIISELDKKYEIMCVDLYYFNKLYKRFDIHEIPTILLMKNGSEFKRISGPASLNHINNILDVSDISTNTE